MTDLQPILDKTISKGYLSCAEIEQQLLDADIDIDVSDCVTLYQRAKLHNEAYQRFLLLAQLIALRKTND